MGNIFHEYDPDQTLLFPPSPRDWLPDGHLAWFISDAVEMLDISELMKAYRPGGKGNLAYHPKMLLKVLIYGYCTGVFSSRSIARELEENVAFRVLAAGQFPNHRTICRFRETHIDHFSKLFTQVVQMAKEARIVKLGTIAVDGTKMKANASKHKAMSHERMLDEEKRLRDEIKTIAKMAKDLDAAEDAQFGPDFRGDELPEELRRRETRRDAIRAAKERLEKRKAEEAAAKVKDGQPVDPDDAKPRPKDQENFTDPDSRIMKTSSGAFEQAYNAQVSVDAEARIIVANDVTQSASDARQLLPMIEATIANTEQKPNIALADAGYRSEENFRALEQLDIKGFIPSWREGKEPTAAPTKPASKRMKQRLDTRTGRLKYRTRKHIVEPVFGWVKNVLGFRSFGLRGLRKTKGEWQLVCLAINLRRMGQLIGA